MNADELITFKGELYKTAALAMSSDSEWGYTLAGNCLPACMSVLSMATEEFPKSRIVIGLAWTERWPFHDIDQAADRIRKFASKLIEQKPDFHAWIEFGNEDIFDSVGPSWFEGRGNKILNSCQYLDSELAEKSGVIYKPVLMDATQVNQFYCQLQIIQRRKK